ncbi:sirohydrochlorin cobaltochelatase [Melghirimyces profundicolus]|uniref:Sirohydrochlorin cobaltochelatase n=1 Tax=Melghirimyces profundicolus TaxID=1242148 RepID=A0A2T6C8E2_9BACL|nr:sirohydrochlorin chelatase [Melghirimyces profundicolus]PTX64569.1 sirohydrochlorin cobaltochelatase [Melghirimyces profundicolus]
MKMTLLIGHGSRDPEGCEEFREMVEKMRQRLPDRRVEFCFLEFESPNVREGVDRCAALGATEVTAIPIMLLDALHYTDDIPRELENAGKRHPGLSIRYGAHLGFHEKMLEVLLQCLREAGEDPTGKNEGAAVLMVGRGSSDPVANSNFFKLARMLWERTTYETVESSFIGLTHPRLEQGIDRCLRLGAKRVLVLPYFLFTGKLYKRIAKITREHREKHPSVDFKLTRHFGLHPLVLEVLEQRVAEAHEGTFTAYDHDWMRDLAEHRYGKRGHHHHHHHHGHGHSHEETAHGVKG